MTPTEKQLKELFDRKYGTDKKERLKKLIEEMSELRKAFYCTEFLDEHVKDELSDVFAVLTHLASIYGLTHKDMLEMAIDKVTKRETDNNYKRF